MIKTIKKSILASVIIGGSILGASVAIDRNTTTNNVETVVADNNYNSRAADTTELEIWVSWTEGNNQWNALDHIVNVWNTKVANDSAPEGAMKVKMVKKTGNYNGITETLQTLLVTNDLIDLPDMYIGYTDVAASLIYLGQDIYGTDLTLDLSESGIKDDILPSLAETNKYIVGGDDDQLYTIPLAVSSEMLGIDAPLFIKLLQNYATQNGTVTLDGEVMRQVIDAADGNKDGQATIDSNGDGIADADDTTEVVYSPLYYDPTADEADITTDNYIENLALSSQDDLDVINRQWVLTGNSLAGSTLNITDETFDSAEGIVDMGNELLMASKISDLSQQGILGYDTAVNNVYTYAQSILDSSSNPENGLIVKDGDKANFNLLNQDSEQWNVAEEIIQFLFDNFKSGALWVPNNGVLFGSDQLRQHSLLMSAGSTAGAWAYTNTEDELDTDPGEVVYTQTPGRLYKDTSKVAVDNVQIQQGPGLGAIKQFEGNSVATEDTARNAAIESFIGWLAGTTTDVEGMTPSQYMSENSGYLFGTKSTLTNEAYAEEMDDPFAGSNGVWEGTEGSKVFTDKGELGNSYILGTQLAYQNIKASTSYIEEGVEPVQLELEPSSVDTASFRSDVDTEIQQQKVNSVNGNKVKSADDILIELHNQGVKAGYVTGGKIFTGFEWWTWMIIVLLVLMVVGIVGYGAYEVISRIKGKNKVKI